MRELDQHICELLYDHDCVIVPQLGGFLASYSGASIHPVLHTITPPSRKVAFNVYLRQNDGLLANHLSGFEHTSYLEAVNKIEAYAAACQLELNAGKRVVIEGLGILYHDTEHNLQFEPAASANFLKDSFGLSPIRHLPLTGGESGTNVQKQQKEFVTIRSSVKADPKKPVVGRTSRKVLSRIVLAGAILWLGANVFLVLKNNKDVTYPQLAHTETGPPKHIPRPESSQASVQPTVNVESTAAIISVPETASLEQHVVGQKQVVEQKEAPLKVESEPLAMHVQRNFSEKEISSPSPSPAPAVRAASSAPEHKVSEDSPTGSRYFIIAGAFKIPENASSFVAQLQAEGFSNAAIVPASGKLTKVCYDAVATRQEAILFLDSLHSQNKDGWVMGN